MKFYVYFDRYRSGIYKDYLVMNSVFRTVSSALRPHDILSLLTLRYRLFVFLIQFTRQTFWLYTRRTIVRRELARIRANSSELARTPREFASSSPTPLLRRTPPNVRRSTPNVRRSSAEFARVRPSSRELRRELANSSPENSFAG